AGEIQAAGGRAAGVGADVGDLGAVRTAVGTLEASLGAVDVLVNNAGWDQLELFVENEPELWDRLITVNLKGVLHVTRTVLDGMIARKRGRIVSISSDAGRVGSTGEAGDAPCEAGVGRVSKGQGRAV